MPGLLVVAVFVVLVEFVREAGDAFGDGFEAAGGGVADGEEDRGPPFGFAAGAVPGGDGDEVDGVRGGGVIFFHFEPGVEAFVWGVG